MFSIGEANLSAFRARLRHLRSLGIPNIPKHGSGRTAIYRRKDLVVTFVALALQTLGSAPTISAKIATFSARYFEKLKSREEDMIIACSVTMHFVQGEGIIVKSAKLVGRIVVWLLF
jgi:hypothetical protein